MNERELDNLSIEVRFVPLSDEELESRQNKLMLLLFKGAKKKYLEERKELSTDRR
jgi:hypothetical protein